MPAFGALVHALASPGGAIGRKRVGPAFVAFVVPRLCLVGGDDLGPFLGRSSDGFAL
jgi:hypothetical protein